MKEQDEIEARNDNQNALKRFHQNEPSTVSRFDM